MTNKWKVVTAINAIVMLFMVAGTVLIVRSQIQGNKNQSQKQQDDKAERVRRQLEQNSDPIADLNFSISTVENGGDIRRKRNEKFRPKDLNGNPINSSRSSFNENSIPVLLNGIRFNLPYQPAIPISKEISVVIGVVKKSDAYVSEDKTNVYSEFKFDVQDILKQSLDNQLSSNEEITLFRYGGKVRLPSGKTLYRGQQGLYLPETGKQYLLFLKQDKEANWFQIVTGYEVQNGLVKPLDGKYLDGGYIRQYRAYQQYEGVDIANFLIIVKNEISSKGEN